MSFHKSYNPKHKLTPLAKPRPDDIHLQVTMVYAYPKSKEIDPEAFIPATNIVKHDLLALGISHPKMANITIPELGRVEFWWRTFEYAFKNKINPTVINLRSRIAQAGADTKLEWGRLSMHSANITLSEERLLTSRQPSDKTHAPSYHPYHPPGQPDRPALPLPSRPKFDTDMDSDNEIQETGGTLKPQPKEQQKDFVKSEPADFDLSDIFESFRREYIKQEPRDGSDDDDLIGALVDVRQEIQRLAAREDDLLGKLRRRGVSLPRGTRTQSWFRLEADLNYERQKLERERRRRAELEDFVDDIKRECREPFVVPALLEAFASVSKLSTDGYRVAKNL
ncbi:hypothetical protein FISHEDRAFT_58868 [Fistulina hepatica ATCC 64428]|uniref:Uncharacterized protein n=1 Tax=Fistulina hepatica ATCC 64428 TaxID=1128425 RepID=A0A0D7AC62_9AGAR|nr:hypothetical protein FISHEDRAFT_58868 [Fistulina hepatica ATCC 64428]